MRRQKVNIEGTGIGKDRFTALKRYLQRRKAESEHEERERWGKERYNDQ